MPTIELRYVLNVAKLLFFIVFVHLPLLFQIVSPELQQSYDCPSTKQVIHKYMDAIGIYVTPPKTIRGPLVYVLGHGVWWTHS